MKHQTAGSFSCELSSVNIVTYDDSNADDNDDNGDNGNDNDAKDDDNDANDAIQVALIF